jgi:hypothetical protein
MAQLSRAKRKHARTKRELGQAIKIARQQAHAHTQHRLMLLAVLAQVQEVTIPQGTIAQVLENKHNLSWEAIPGPEPNETLVRLVHVEQPQAPV